MRCLPGHDNGRLSANRLAQFAGHALFLIHHRKRLRLEQGQASSLLGGEVLIEGFHGDAIKRTGHHTEITACAVVFDDFSFRNLDRLDALDITIVWTADAGDRAVNAAHATINTDIGINQVKRFALTGDGTGGAIGGTHGAADAVLMNVVRHDSPRPIRPVRPVRIG